MLQYFLTVIILVSNHVKNVLGAVESMIQNCLSNFARSSAGTHIYILFKFVKVNFSPKLFLVLLLT